MASGAQALSVSKNQLWAGRIISALPALLLLFSGVMKLLKPAPVLQGLAHYGYPESLIVVIGILEIACTLVYVIPRTSYVGAIFRPAYLGGTTASNMRAGDPSYFATVLLGVMVGAGVRLAHAGSRAL